MLGSAVWLAQLTVLLLHQKHAAPVCGASPEVARVLLWLGTCYCSFLHLGVCGAAAEADANQPAQLVVGELLLQYKYDSGVDELVSVGIQRLQHNNNWKLWMWPPAAKEFFSAKECM